MENYIDIIGIVASITGLVPIMTAPKRTKFWAVTVAALSLIILLMMYQIVQSTQKEQAIASTKGEIENLLLKSQSGMSFDQIYDGTFYRDFSVVNNAVDSLVEEKKVIQGKIETKDENGNNFTIRKYSKP
jgi:hypothetical protein